MHAIIYINYNMLNMFWEGACQSARPLISFGMFPAIRQTELTDTTYLATKNLGNSHYDNRFVFYADAAPETTFLHAM